MDQTRLARARGASVNGTLIPMLSVGPDLAWFDAQEARMLNRLLSALSWGRQSWARQPSGNDRRIQGAAEAHAFFSRQPARMSQVKAPPAANDDVMAPMYEGVEHALKRAGYLR